MAVLRVELGVVGLGVEGLGVTGRVGVVDRVGVAGRCRGACGDGGLVTSQSPVWIMTGAITVSGLLGKPPRGVLVCCWRLGLDDVLACTDACVPEAWTMSGPPEAGVLVLEVVTPELARGAALFSEDTRG